MNQQRRQMRQHNELLMHEYEERLSSLLADGYCKRFEHRDSQLWYAKLKHMANGNQIDLKCNFALQTLSQMTNHILKFLLVV